MKWHIQTQADTTQPNVFTKQRSNEMAHTDTSWHNTAQRVHKTVLKWNGTYRPNQTQVIPMCSQNSAQMKRHITQTQNLLIKLSSASWQHGHMFQLNSEQPSSCQSAQNTHRNITQWCSSLFTLTDAKKRDKWKKACGYSPQEKIYFVHKWCISLLNNSSEADSGRPTVTATGSREQWGLQYYWSCCTVQGAASQRHSEHCYLVTGWVETLWSQTTKDYKMDGTLWVKLVGNRTAVPSVLTVLLGLAWHYIPAGWNTKHYYK